MNTSVSDVDQLRQSLTPAEHVLIRLLDLQRLKVEQSGISAVFAAQLAEPTYGVFACLQIWLLLALRIEDEWRAVDYHMVYEYLNDLTVRDAIDDYLDAMPSALRDKIGRFVARVDERYMAVTIEDGGAELAQYWKPLADGQEIRWWWTRKPLILPPGW